MTEQVVVCPNCSHEIKLTEAISLPTIRVSIEQLTKAPSTTFHRVGGFFPSPLEGASSNSNRGLQTTLPLASQAVARLNFRCVSIRT